MITGKAKTNFQTSKHGNIIKGDLLTDDEGYLKMLADHGLVEIETKPEVKPQAETKPQKTASRKTKKG